MERKYYQKNRQHYAEYALSYYYAHKNDKVWVERKRLWGKEYRDGLRLMALKVYSEGDIIHCADCGIKDIEVLQIDHINGGGNQHRKELGYRGRGSAFYNLLRNQGYPSGYGVLCANCNIKKAIKERVVV